MPTNSVVSTNATLATRRTVPPVLTAPPLTASASWHQGAALPTCLGPEVLDPVVQAIAPPDPELVPRGQQPVPAPRRGKRHVAVGESLARRREPCLQPLVIAHRPALVGRPRRQPATQRTGREIGGRLVRGQPLHGAGHAYLALE